MIVQKVGNEMLLTEKPTDAAELAGKLVKMLENRNELITGLIGWANQQQQYIADLKEDRDGLRKVVEDQLHEITRSNMEHAIEVGDLETKIKESPHPIPNAERLPSQDQLVIILGKGCVPKLAWKRTKDGETLFQATSGNYYAYHPYYTHWMEIPEIDEEIK